MGNAQCSKHGSFQKVSFVLIIKPPQELLIVSDMCFTVPYAHPRHYGHLTLARTGRRAQSVIKNPVNMATAVKQPDFCEPLMTEKTRVPLYFCT